MSDNDQDTNNNGQQNQPSKLAKPANLEHYFNKIQSNPKFWQLEAKVKPNRNDKNTKLTYKTNYNQLFGWGWLNNSKLKFQTKEGKTKLSINNKMGNGNQDRDNGKKQEKWSKIKEEGSADLKQLEEIEGKKKNSNIQKEDSQKQNGQSKNNDGQNLDISFSTAYENAKINVRIKDRGQINFKFNYSIDIISQILKAKLESFWQFKNRGDTIKHSLELLYTNGLKKQQYEILDEKQQKRTFFHKNQTKIKAKLSDHSDTQIKLNSINHFGEEIDPNSINIEQTKDISSQAEQTSDNSGKQDQQGTSTSKTPANERIRQKLQLQHKLTLPKTGLRQFNYKISLNCQSVILKQSLKLQTFINQYGFNNFQSRYIFKNWNGFTFGGMAGIAWNSYSQQWKKKWEIIVEKQKIPKLGNILTSINDKTFGLKLVKKLRSSKIQFMASKKWSENRSKWPKFGVKINVNW